ncbi:MAG: LL-diaminopimelate aminotransferase [Phoenicibacter congonensis]|uniref:LL-diaminopimelate aminotransferase n=1 Tax=Phoenicibacter congonensis TaxID=1944646 RepID=A0AA43RJ56_9ACTN|nr:LL-diaminopimelate aminotransferase [Phoenicibacter congonensis]
MKIKMNENFKAFKDNYLFVECAKRIADFQAANPDAKVIKLSIGDVTRPLPKVAIDALNVAVEEQAHAETFRGYAPESGYDFTRQAVADYYTRRGAKIEASEVFISDGAKSDCGNVLDILGNNKVYVPDPVYPVYVDTNIMKGNEIAYLPGTLENGFAPMPTDEIEEGSVIYICSPNNPTGSVYNREQLTEWVNFANERGCLIIFDSAYEAFVSGDNPRSIFEIEGARTCAVEICSLSKTAGFTGTRCGWMILAHELEAAGMNLNATWSRRQSTRFNGVPYIIQRAAAAALSEDGIKVCMENIEYYKSNAKKLSEFLTSKGYKFTGGTNSPYIWMQTKDNMPSWGFFDLLLNEAQIAGTPGVGFGSQGEGFFRITSFGKAEDYDEAIRRLERIL